MFEANKLNYVPLLRKQVELYISNRSVFIKTLLPAKPVLLAGETCAACRRNLCCLPAKPVLLAGETCAACRRNLCCLPAKPVLLACETRAACLRNLCCLPAKPVLQV